MPPTPDVRKAGEDSRQQAAQLLITETALADLSIADARIIVGHMSPRRLAAGATFIREGEVTHTDFMLLVMRGEVAVESDVSVPGDTMVMSVLGPGSLIGEMGLFDGAPRSATCVAATDLAVAVMSRAALAELMEQQPAVAARLLLAISKRLSDRLREANRKLKMLAGLTRAQQQELDLAHRMLGRLSPRSPQPVAGGQPPSP